MKAEFDINEIVKKRMIMNITLKGTTKFLIKLKIAKWFFIIGAKILGCGIKFNESRQTKKANRHS